MNQQMKYIRNSFSLSTFSTSRKCRGLLLTGVFWATCVYGQPSGAPSSGLRPVPYRLASTSGEDIEITVFYDATYKKIDHVAFDITKPASDGSQVFKLKSKEGGSVVVTMKIKKNHVESGQITGEGPGAAVVKSLSLSSRSGEVLTFTFGGTATPGAGSATVTSSRIK